jgi:G3E family GTPase
MAAAWRGRRVVFLVNDFAAVDVDTRRLAAESPNVVAIPGGSIFCRCLVTEFVARLRQVAEVFDRPEAPVEAVVVEASGMADPSVLDDLLAECGLARRFEVRSVTALVDPGTFAKLLVTLPNVRRQVEAADRVVVNKCDLFGEAELARVEAAVRAIRPDVALVRAVRAAVDLDAPAGAHVPGRHGELAPCRDPNFEARAIAVGAPVDPAALRAVLERAGDAVHRAKGLVPTPGGLVDVDWAGGRFEVRPWAGPSDAPCALAVIFRGAPSAALVAAVESATGARTR